MLPEFLKKYLDEMENFDKYPIPIMDIKYPILMSYQTDFDVYILYITKFKRLSKKLEYITVKSNYEEIIDVLNQEYPLNYLFKEKKISKRTVEKNQDIDRIQELFYKDMIDILPQDDFFLDQKYPNKKNLKEVLASVIIQKSIYDTFLENYEVSNKFMSKDNQKNIFELNSYQNKIKKESIFNHKKSIQNIDNKLLGETILFQNNWINIKQTSEQEYIVLKDQILTDKSTEYLFI